jgi:cytochrome c
MDYSLINDPGQGFIFSGGTTMFLRILVIGFSVFFGLARAEAAGDAERGQRAFGQCAACHSLEPGRHLTGPSLARIWKRKAGTIEGFPRYSEALKKSGIVWDERTLDRWLKESQSMVPGNLMTFPDIREGRVRADLIAYLNDVSSGRRVAEIPRRGGMMGGSMLNLKELGKDLTGNLIFGSRRTRVLTGLLRALRC